MAYTYLVLNILFFAVVALLLVRKVKKPGSSWWITLAALMALTLIFDNIFIQYGMFTYNPDLILGVTIGAAPVEDFFYSLLACMIVPLLWNKFKPNTQRGKN